MSLILTIVEQKASINIIAVTALCGKKLQRYSTLSIILKNEPLIWANIYGFYNLGLTAQAFNSAHIP
jgi:hypothetical protein